MDATQDIEYLVRSDHRVGVLTELAGGPCDRRDLRAAIGASSPTIGRILSDFQDRHWIERDGDTYRLTGLGQFVATKFMEFGDAMTYESRLREVWPWLPHEIDGFGIELFTDVVVATPGTGYPYAPIERLSTLINTTRTMRGFGMAILKSSNLETFFERARDGMECEYIYPPAVFEELLAWDEETVVETVSGPNYDVLLHDDLPLEERCGICLFDERVSICCFDPETGALQSLVDSGGDEIRAWAASYYDRLKGEAEPLVDVNAVNSVESV